MQLHNAKDLLGKLESSSAEQIGKSCLEACLDTVVISLSLVCEYNNNIILSLIKIFQLFPYMISFCL